MVKSTTNDQNTRTSHSQITNLPSQFFKRNIQHTKSQRNNIMSITKSNNNQENSSNRAAADSDDIVLVSRSTEEEYGVSTSDVLSTSATSTPIEGNPYSSSESNVNGSGDSRNLASRRQAAGAAVGGGVVGYVLGGPILALAGAGGGAVAASSSSGKIGNVARRSGDAVADAGDRIRRFNSEHRVVEKASTSIKKTCDKVSSTKVGRKGSEVVERVGYTIRKFDEKHRVIEKTSNTLTKGCDWMSKKLHNNRYGTTCNCPPTTASTA